MSARSEGSLDSLFPHSLFENGDRVAVAASASGCHGRNRVRSRVSGISRSKGGHRNLCVGSLSRHPEMIENEVVMR